MAGPRQPWDTLCLRALPLYGLLHPLKKVENTHVQSLGDEVKAGERDVHPAIFERPDLSPMAS